MKVTHLIIYLISLVACSQKDETIEPIANDYDYEVLTDQADVPWGFDFLPDKSMLITNRDGKLFHHKSKTTKQIKGVPEVYADNQGGLLDIKVHPDYPEQPWIYISYSSIAGEKDGAHTALARAQLDGNQLTNLEVLYKATPNTTKGIHFGSRIEFDNDGFLYLTIGERGQRDVNPQDITRDGGKVYRFYDDGRIPKSNPFYDEPNAKKAIYSYGHRNPQGIERNPETGKIWVHEHGPRGGDEINIIKKGANYGWPVITYGINYSGTEITDETARPGMEQPFYYWVPSIAPSGMTFVRSDKYPHLNGNLLVGSLKFAYLEHLIINNNQVQKREKILMNQGRLRSVKQGPDGYLYAGIEGIGVVKILPKT
jgi:glucose/arabinose dehydrogenase